MKKIPSLFMRNHEGNNLVRDEIVPGSEWVTSGEGVATRKWDGTCCLVRDGKLYKRYDAKNGKKPPEGFVPAQEPDPITGHWPGWVLVGNGPEDKYHREVWEADQQEAAAYGDVPMYGDGQTLELIGPKIQGNPENVAHRQFIVHGRPCDVIADAPRDFEGLKAYFATANIEGIVWHHPDGRMVKIKTGDFGLKRGVSA